MDEKPVVATVIGDPSGVGPEVCVKALATGEPHQVSKPVLVGSVAAVTKAIGYSSLDLDARRIERLAEARFEERVVDVLDVDPLAEGETTLGQPSAAGGRAVVSWLRLAEELAESGEVAAFIMAPVDSAALKLAGAVESIDDLQPPGTVMFRVSGALRIGALSEHIPIKEVPSTVTKDAILGLIELVDGSLRKWGANSRRYGVAGLNPHATGDEDEREIVPAIEAAKAAGMDVVGPVPPDSVFRQCLEGKYDVVFSMYHDQGQVALKTAAFEGACTLYLGLPYLRLTIPHGSAYDIAGRGIAQHRSMLAAMMTAGSLASSRGFPSFAGS